MTRYLSLFLFMNIALFAQSAKVTVALQPLEVFKAAFGGQLKGVGLYKATVCNTTYAGLKLSEGVIVQAVEKKVGTIDPLLVFATAQRSKKGGKLYKTAKALEWGAYSVSLFTAGGSIAASNGVRLGLVALTGISRRASDQLAEDSDFNLSNLNQFLDPQRSIVLEGRACASKLTLGAFRKVFDPYEVLIQ